MSINYIEINRRALELLLSVKKHVPAIEGRLRALVEIRVSQINGCAYCVDLHSREARELGVNQQMLDCLSVWRESGIFSDSDMAAFAWAEAVTLIAAETDMEPGLSALLKHYNEAEVVDLTVIISLMNAMNRLAISFGDRPQRVTA